MAMVITDDKHYSSIAQAIREKTGEETAYKPEEMPAGVEAAYEAGLKTEHDRFWDDFQLNGSRTNYQAAFSYWSDVTFQPKYNIVPTGNYGAANMFQYSTITDLKKILEETGAVLDFSEAGALNGTFDRSTISSLPIIDLTSCTSLTMTFYNMAELTALQIINLGENCTFDRTMPYCTKLTHLSITGTIGQNGFSVANSNGLTHDSLMSILDALADKSEDTSGTTWLVRLGATNLEKLTDDEKAIATQKGWTLA